MDSKADKKEVPSVKQETDSLDLPPRPKKVDDNTAKEVFGGRPKGSPGVSTSD